MATRKVLSSQENVSNVEEGPPKPPRTAFMCFSDSKCKEFETKDLNKKDIIRRVAALWKSISDKDRAEWEEAARNDKLRYIRAKSTYKGPWNIPKRRAKKHPGAPRRPMSAFLKYSQTRRSLAKEQNPDMSNTDVSRLLGEMWRGASQRERHPYVEQEERERAVYKQQMAEFRAKQARLDAASRTLHASLPAAPDDHYEEHHQSEGRDVSAPSNMPSVYRHPDHYHHHHQHHHGSHAAYAAAGHAPNPHYGYSFSHAPSFDSFVDAAPSFVDSIPESHHVQHHLSPPREAVFRDDPRFGSEENRYPLPRFP